MNYLNVLKTLYFQKSKHSNYQILSKKLSRLININISTQKPRYENERFSYILLNVDLTNKVILDIGGNTGYFSFEAIDNGAKKVNYIEGNIEHSNFVKLSAKVLKIENKITIQNKYFNFDTNEEKKYDIVFLLNVLHHLGDDYGSKSLSILNAKKMIIKQINNLSKLTSILVFQIGYNWQGNIDKKLFKNGTKKEMIQFINNGTKNNWEIVKIGIADKNNKNIIYHDLNDTNIKRVDELGEFLNRPIFILKSKHITDVK